MIKNKHDHMLLLLTIALLFIGIVMVFSTSFIFAEKKYNDGYFFLKAHLKYALAGLILMFTLMKYDYEKLKKIAYPLYIAGIVILMLLVFIPKVGQTIGGATRWIKIWKFSFQPSEFAKGILVVFLAYYLSKKEDLSETFKIGFIAPFLFAAVYIGLIYKQPDFGAVMIIILITLIMLFSGGVKLKYLGFSLLALLPFIIYAVLAKPYRVKRILTFLDPWEDPTGAGFQITQSFIAFGNGGVFGTGLGEGMQKLFYLPEAHTDFIFAVVGEELGLIGVFGISFLFLFFVLRGIKISLYAKDSFGMYLGVGMTSLLGLQAFMNMSVVLGLVPTKGLTLPFISYGGSSLVMSLCAVGLILNISKTSSFRREVDEAGEI